MPDHPRYHYSQLTIVIGEILTNHDPVGLIESGCSKHEYDLEVVHVLEAILDSSNSDVLSPKLKSIFETRFGTSFTSPIQPHEWQLLAEDLWSAWTKYPKNDS